LKTIKPKSLAHKEKEQKQMMGSERYGAVIEARDHPHSVGGKKNRM